MFFNFRSVVVLAAIFTASIQAKISSPAKGETWAAGKMQTVRWDASEMKGRMKMHLCKGGATDISESILIISELVENTGSYSWMPDKSMRSLNSFTIVIVDIEIESCKSVSDDFCISGLHESSNDKTYCENSEPSKDNKTESDSHHEYKTHAASRHEYKTQSDSHHEYKTVTRSESRHEGKTHTRSEKKMTRTRSSTGTEHTYTAHITIAKSSSMESQQTYSVETPPMIESSTVSTYAEVTTTAEAANTTYTPAPIADSQPSFSTFTTEVTAAAYTPPPPPYTTAQAQASNISIVVLGTAAASTSSGVVVFTGAASGLSASAGIVAILGVVGLLFLL